MKTSRPNQANGNGISKADGKYNHFFSFLKKILELKTRTPS
jgi:hypothetical protein